MPRSRSSAGGGRYRKLNRGPSAQREHAAALGLRTDQVVVRQPLPVVAIVIALDVADQRVRIRAAGDVRSRLRQRPGDAHQLRSRAACGTTSRAEPAQDGYAPEDLLRLDQFGTARAHPLHHQVEQILVLRADAVVVDRGAQEFVAAGADARQRQPLAARRQFDGGRASVATTRTITAWRPPCSKNCSTACGSSESDHRPPKRCWNCAKFSTGTASLTGPLRRSADEGDDADRAGLDRRAESAPPDREWIAVGPAPKPLPADPGPCCAFTGPAYPACRAGPGLCLARLLFEQPRARLLPACARSQSSMMRSHSESCAMRRRIA